MIKVMIFEDNRTLRESIKSMLQAYEGIEVVGDYGHCKNIEKQIDVSMPDIILMDINLPEINGIEALKKIKPYLTTTYVIMLTMFEQDDYIFDAICHGASGYLLKKASPDEIIKAIHDVKEGGTAMTPSIAKKIFLYFQNQERPIQEENSLEKLTIRETEVLVLLTKGYTYRMVAAELHISFETVRTFIKRIYQKLQVHSNTEAVAYALKNRIQ
jgi:DNA-binding NarL/FixJ family response regulator